MAAPRVWVTRAQPGADATADRLRALGIEPVVRPVLRVEPLRPDLPDLDSFAALAFTSRNGVTAFTALTPRRDQRVFAVGDATAEAARDAGYLDVISADGDLIALGALIAARETGPVLAPTAETPAGSMQEAVVRAGGTTRITPLAIYRTVATDWPAASDRAESPGDSAFAAVLIHSPRAGAVVAQRLDDASQEAVFVCISAAAAAPLQALGRDCVIADHPSEAAMFKSLNPALGKRRRPV